MIWFLLHAILLCAHGTEPGTATNAATGSASLAFGSELDELLQKQVLNNPQISLIAAEADAAMVRYYAAGRIGIPEGVSPEKTIFEIGSITKVFTGLLLAQAVIEHRVRLDDPISRYLPSSLKLSPTTGAITLQQLATHTSGLPRMPANFAPADELNPYADYGVEKLYQFLESFQSPGPSTTLQYSNLGAGLLGHVLTLVYGKSYPALLAEKITGPLGLKDTVIDLNEEQAKRLAEPRDGPSKIKPWTSDVLMGCGCIRSTASDLVQFAQALMSETSPLEAAWQITRECRVGSSDTDGWGLGIGISNGREGTRYGHPGITGGYRAHLTFSPSIKHVLVILTNNTEGSPNAILDALYNRPSPTELADRTAAQEARKTRPEAPISSEQVAEYAGVYRRKGSKPSDPYLMVVLDETGHLRWRLTGHSFRPLCYAGDDRFFSRWSEVQVRFERDPRGKISTIIVSESGDETSMFRADAEPTPTIQFLKPEALQGYVGIYALAPERDYVITLKSDQLFAKITGQETVPVFSVGVPDQFVYDVVEATLSFERDANGAVKALVLHQNGRDQTAPQVSK